MNELVPEGVVRVTSQYGKQRVRGLREWRYTAAWLHGPSWEQAVILDGVCEHRHLTHEAAANCARRLAKLDGLRIEEL